MTAVLGDRDPARVVVAATVVCILTVTLASGPLVPGVTFTGDPEARAPGSGRADVTVVSVPDTATLQRGRFGAHEYYLQVPAAVVDVESVEGRPLLVYKLRIEELMYVRGSTYFLSEADTGRLGVSLEADTFAPDRLTRERYRGELVLLVRANGEDEVLHRGEVTVEVRR